MQHQRLVLSLLLATACGGDSTKPNPTIEGSYTATVFNVVPQGLAAVNVLAAGGSLSITIAASGATTGTLSVPASAAGGTAFSASMAGTATLTGPTISFSQGADTFVRDLRWAFADKTLSVQNQTVGAATFTITLTRP